MSTEGTLPDPLVERMTHPLVLQPDEFAAVKARLLELENAITWHTSCLSCSAFLDRANAERERAEHAEAKLAAIKAYCRDGCEVVNDGLRLVAIVRASDILAIISEEVHLGG